MKKAISRLACRAWSMFRTCRYCGYSGGAWRDDDQCPNCGEVN